MVGLPLFQVLYNSDGWFVARSGRLVLIVVDGVTVSGSGTWQTTTCPYSVPTPASHRLSSGNYSRGWYAPTDSGGDTDAVTRLYVSEAGAGLNKVNQTSSQSVKCYGELFYLADE